VDSGGFGEIGAPGATGIRKEAAAIKKEARAAYWGMWYTSGARYSSSFQAGWFQDLLLRIFGSYSHHKPARAYLLPYASIANSTSMLRSGSRGDTEAVSHCHTPGIGLTLQS
jgi:hypothetical protein